MVKKELDEKIIYVKKEFRKSRKELDDIIKSLEYDVRQIRKYLDRYKFGKENQDFYQTFLILQDFFSDFGRLYKEYERKRQRYFNLHKRYQKLSGKKIAHKYRTSFDLYEYLRKIS